MDISIIGTGNVAYHLARAIDKSTTYKVCCICGRSKQKASSTYQKKGIQYADNICDIPPSTIVIVAVTDDQIATVSRKIAVCQQLSKCIIAHTSGSVPSSVLQQHDLRGVFYPLQTFTRGKRMSYKNIPFCISGSSSKVEKVLVELAQQISRDVRLVNDEARAAIHLSAVLVNNMVNHIVYLAQKRLSQHDISGDILIPLIEETVKKLLTSTAYDAQTGPARRGDHQILKEQIAKLENSPVLQEVYIALSDSIKKTYQK